MLFLHIYTHLYKCIWYIQVHKDTTKVDSKKFLVWFVFFLFFLLVFFFCKQQIAFQWHDCCSSLLLVRCVCSDKTNVHMLYTISSNTYFAFLPSNLATIEYQRREICLKTRIPAMPTTKLAFFHIFAICSELTALTITICICMYVCMCLTVCTIFNSILCFYKHIYLNIHLNKQKFT